MNMDPNEFLIVQVAGGLVTLLTAALLLAKIIIPGVRRVKLWFLAWDQFMCDWSGEDARPDRDRVPGVMERLNAIDGELKRNGGSSVKDAVDRIEINVNEISNKTGQIDLRLQEGDKRFDEIEKRLDNIDNKP